MMNFEGFLRLSPWAYVGIALRLAQLQTWCARAETAGVATLREFARDLRGYRMRLA